MERSDCPTAYLGFGRIHLNIAACDAQEPLNLLCRGPSDELAPVRAGLIEEIERAAREMVVALIVVTDLNRIVQTGRLASMARALHPCAGHDVVGYLPLGSTLT